MLKTLIGAVGLLAASLVTGTPSAAAEPPAEPARLVALTDQQYEDRPAARIRLMDSAVVNWTTPAAEKWAWSPTSANGFGDLTGAWGLPTDVKLRKRSGDQVAVVSDSLGLAAMISYPAGKRLWGVNVGATANPHSVELLPDGNVAVAASTGGFVRVYAASQGPAAAKYVQYDLHDAHGVSWDPTRKVLWALGGNRLVALKVTGTAADPLLEESRVITLPTGGGHDLAPALEDGDVFWISTLSKVYRFSKSTATILAAEDKSSVKSVSSMPDGRRVLTRPKAGCRTTWCTDTVEFSGPTATRTLPGAQIYKARVWSSRYE